MYSLKMYYNVIEEVDIVTFCSMQPQAPVVVSAVQSLTQLIVKLLWRQPRQLVKSVVQYAL